MIRAPQVTTSPPPVNTSPFFPDPTTFHTAKAQPSNQTGGLAKSVLEYLFLSVALLIVGCTVFRRLVKFKRTHKPLRTFFHPENATTSPSHLRAHSYPRTTGLPPIYNDGRPYPPYPDHFLTGFPPVYLGHTGRRTNAGDVDARGRRLADRTVELDHDGELGDKDALPAYEVYGGPPKYIELEFQSRLLGNETRRPSPADAPSSSGDESNLEPDSFGVPRTSPQGNENGRDFPGSLSTGGHPSTAPTNTVSNTRNTDRDSS